MKEKNEDKKQGRLAARAMPKQIPNAPASVSIECMQDPSKNDWRDLKENAESSL